MLTETLPRYGGSSERMLLGFPLMKPSSFTAPEIIAGLQYFHVHYVFSLITSIISPSSAIYFHILFCNGLAVPKSFSTLIIIVGVIV